MVYSRRVVEDFSFVSSGMVVVGELVVSSFKVCRAFEERRCWKLTRPICATSSAGLYLIISSISSVLRAEES